ncbi:MAG: DUF3857 domain-containing protein [Bacteroidota bacterium]
MMRQVSILLILLLSSLTMWGQDGHSLLFGEIDSDWLTLESFPSDTGVSAAILMDMGMVTFEMFSRTPVIRYEYRRLIKIFSEEALSMGHIELPYNPRREALFDIRAATHNLNSEDEPVSFRIDKRKIREERTKDGKRVKIFDLPFVRVGSVLEIQYVIKAKDFETLRRWQFQQDLPVILSEYHALIPASYSYQILVSGNPNKVHRMTRQFRQDQPVVFNDRSRFEYGSLGTMDNGYRSRRLRNSGSYEIFIASDLPALVKESFSPQHKDFIPSVEFQLAKDHLYGRENPNLFDNWKELNQKTLKKFRPKKLKADRKLLLARVNRLSRRATSDDEKAQTILSWIQKEIKWDGTYTTSAKRLDQVLSSKSGSSAEINLLLLNMLQVADLEAYPVLISTKDHGRIQTVYPNTTQFNHLIVAARLQGVEMLLDGLSPHNDLGFLPENDLTEVGFLLDQDGGRWVQLRSQNRMIRYTYSRFSLDESGQLNGEVSVSNQAYSAVVERDRLDKEGDEETYLRKHVLTGISEADVANLVVENSGVPGKPFLVNCDLKTEDFVEIADQHMFINPLLTKQVAENPFPLGERSTPLDLTYPLRESHMLGLRLPEGYEVAQLPEPIRVVLPNKQGSFTYNVIHLDNIVHFTSSIYLNKTLFLPEEYDTIRSFFDYIVEKHGEDLIIRKIQ